MIPDSRLVDGTPLKLGQPIAELAANLDIREIDVFRLAHRWWYGREADARSLERCFAAYMFRGQVPPWARQYAREVLDTRPADEERIIRLGLDRLAGSPPAPRHGPLVVAGTAVAFAVLFAAVLMSTYDPQTSAPIVRSERPLSCAGGGPGLAFLEDLAFALGGRKRPDC